MMSWDQITFICRDGCVTGNRFILTNYSRLLSDALESCQGKGISGNNNKPAIHLKNTSIRDLKCLFTVLYSLTFAEISNPRLTGLQNVARLLDIDLTLRNGRNGFVRIMASPISQRDSVNGGSASACTGIISSAAAIAATSAVSRPSSPLCISSGIVNPSDIKFKPRAEKMVLSHNNKVSESQARDPRKRRVDQASQKNSSIVNDGTQTDPELEMDYTPPQSLIDQIDEKPVISEDRRLSIDMNENEMQLAIDPRGFSASFSSSQDYSNSDLHDINHNNLHYEYDSSNKLRKNGPGAGLYSTKKYYTKTANKDEYTCNLCHHIANCWSSIKAHIETQHYHLEFQCKKCQFVSVWRADMVKHIRNYHKSRSSSEDTYITRQRKEFSGEAELNPEPSNESELMESANSFVRADIKSEIMDDDLPSSILQQELVEEEEEDIEEEEPLIEGNGSLSTNPARTFERLSSRIPDINKDCYEVTKVGNRKVYKCLSCSKECKTYCGIREHQYSTHYGYICICNHCDVKYRSRSNMFKHLNLAHNIIKNFTQHFGYLIEDGHQKIPEIPQDLVDTSGKFKCKICANTFSDKEIIINHLIYKHRIKSDVSPFYEEIDEQIISQEVS